MMSSFLVHPQNSFLVLENSLIFGALGALWVFLRTPRSLSRGVAGIAEERGGGLKQSPRKQTPAQLTDLVLIRSVPVQGLKLYIF